MITEKMLNKKVKQLNERMGRPTTAYSKNDDGIFTANVGHILLDHNPTYGGSLLMVMESRGGQSNFGPIPYRLKNKEMDVYLTGVLTGLSMK